MSTTRKCLEIAALMWLNFALVAANFRFLAKTNWPGTLLTDLAIAWFGWTLFHRVKDATGRWERAAYCLGAVLGSATALLLT